MYPKEDLYKKPQRGCLSQVLAVKQKAINTCYAAIRQIVKSKKAGMIR
jgi:hypothetical protein